MRVVDAKGRGETTNASSRFCSNVDQSLDFWLGLNEGPEDLATFTSFSGGPLKDVAPPGPFVPVLRSAYVIIRFSSWDLLVEAWDHGGLGSILGFERRNVWHLVSLSLPEKKS